MPIVASVSAPPNRNRTWTAANAAKSRSTAPRTTSASVVPALLGSPGLDAARATAGAEPAGPAGAVGAPGAMGAADAVGADAAGTPCERDGSAGRSPAGSARPDQARSPGRAAAIATGPATRNVATAT